MRKHASHVLWTVAACLLAAGCAAEDLTSIRLTVGPDGSGSITIVSVEAPSDPTAVENATSGVEWGDRVTVKASAGEFTSLSSVRVAGISFNRSVSDDGVGILNVVLPLKPDRPWARTLAPIPEDKRAALAEMYDPDGELRSIGASLMIVVTLPGDVVTQGTIPDKRGIEGSQKKDTATLIVPVDVIAPCYESISWHVTWQQ